MLLSLTTLVDNVDEYCWSIVVRCWQRTISMLLEQESTIVDETSLLICQQWLNNGCWTWTTVNNATVVDRVQHNIVRVCSTTLQQVVETLHQVVHFSACTRRFINKALSIIIAKKWKNLFWTTYTTSCCSKSGVGLLRFRNQAIKRSSAPVVTFSTSFMQVVNSTYISVLSPTLYQLRYAVTLEHLAEFRSQVGLLPWHVHLST